MVNTSEVVRFFTAHHAVYDRFINWVGYPRALRSFFGESQLLRSDLRVLDAGCGTGALTIALYEAFERKAVAPKVCHAFDLTPAMVRQLQQKLERRGISSIATAQERPSTGPVAAWVD